MKAASAGQEKENFQLHKYQEFLAVMEFLENKYG